MPNDLLIAILAAGASRRLGQPKQLVSVGGESLLRRQCRIAVESRIGPVVVVLGHEVELCSAAIAGLQVGVCRNEEWREGLAASIRTAARTALDHNAAGLLILHGDQYRVTAEDLQTMGIAWTESGRIAVCRARQGDYVGPPVVFPSRLLSQLLLLQGDEGARRIIAAVDPGSLIDVEMPNSAYDLDLPDQLVELTRSSDG